MAKSSTSRTKKKATATRKSSSNAKKSPKTKKSAVKKKPTATKKAAAKKAPAAKKTTKAASKKKAAGDEVVLVDRRKNSKPAAATAHKLQRREKVNRRRQIDPTTCERDYSHEEVEFMAALDEYKRQNGRMFPTCSEILEVIRELGYQKVQKTELPVVEPVAETPVPVPTLPESPVLSLSDDYALPADESEVFGF